MNDTVESTVITMKWFPEFAKYVCAIGFVGAFCCQTLLLIEEQDKNKDVKEKLYWANKVIEETQECCDDFNDTVAEGDSWYYYNTLN